MLSVAVCMLRRYTASYYWTISDNGRCRKLGKSLSGAQRTSRGKTEVILTVKMETRHPIGGAFGREFSLFVIIAEL